jgi:hypothetical protein
MCHEKLHGSWSPGQRQWFFTMAIFLDETNDGSLACSAPSLIVPGEWVTDSIIDKLIHLVFLI